MVWGMSLPSSFGEFWPNGDFEDGDNPDAEGWGGRLKRFFKEQMSNVQKEIFEDSSKNGPRNYAYFVSGKFIREQEAAINPEYSAFESIEDHEAPRTFNTIKIYKELGSLIKLNGRIIAVDNNLKEIIEKLEPNVHQFFPIEIRMPRGKIYPVQYYTLVIGQYFDSFSREGSKEGSWSEEAPGWCNFDETKKGMSGLSFCKAAFGRSHLWRERGFREWLTCFSDELQAEIAQAGLRMPKKFYPMKEI